jgi:hypothetical protein
MLPQELFPQALIHISFGDNQAHIETFLYHLFDIDKSLLEFPEEPIWLLYYLYH